MKPERGFYVKILHLLYYFFAAAAGAVITALFIIYFPLQGAREAHGPAETEAIETIVGKYLAAHPEAVTQAIARLREQERAAQLESRRSAIEAKAAEIFHDSADPVLGNPKGDVTVVEFFDYRCPYCKASQPNIMAALRKDGNIRLVLKEFPILGPNSVLASRAALASRKQGKYAVFHTALLESQSSLDSQTIFSLAEAAGLDVTRLAEDMKDPAIDELIKKNYALAEALRIDGTPTFIIGDQLVPGAVGTTVLERLIESARKKS